MNETSSAPDGLSRLFSPRSVAVVGASRDPDKVGYMALCSVLEGGFAGDVYAINPSAGEILGLQAYPSLSSVPGDVDLIIVAIPAPNVPQAIQEAADKGVGAAVILSGGFREAGRVDLENQLAAIVRDSDLRILGPNCQGVNYLPNSLNASFWLPQAIPGSMAVISQSGTVAATLTEWATEEHLGVSATVCLGNQVDICEADLLSFFADDPQTEVMTLYLEGAKNGPRFVEVLRRLAPKKPVVILKSGRTGEGQRAASSHTRSLAGRDAVFDAACRQFGVVRAADLESLYDSAKALNILAPPQRNRLMIVTSSGGAGILAVDEAEQGGLRLSRLASPLVEELRRLDLPRNAVLSNPLDLTVCSATDFKRAVWLLGRHHVADTYLLIYGDPIEGAAEAVGEINARLPGRVVVAFLGGGEIEKVERPRIQAAGVPVFPTPERAVRAIADAVWWHSRSGRSVDAA